jgi:DNA polymerase-3 subunit alpha
MKVQSRTWQLKEGQFVGNECAWPSSGGVHGCKQRHVNEFVVQQARRLESPLLLTLDAHFVKPETKMVQDILLQNGNKNGWRASSAYYQMDTEQAWAAWVKNHGSSPDHSKIFQEAVENNTAFADMIESITIETKYHLPEVEFPIEIQAAHCDQNQKLIAFLMKRILYHGRMPRDPSLRDTYLVRLQKEIEVIANNGRINFLPYFLIIDLEICSHVRERGHLVGPGRGSAAGSLLSYLLKITHLDPIAWNLSFERFLSLGRIRRGKFPDIDLDFGDPKLVVDHLKTKYGERFARICTTGTAKLKGAIRDVSRILLRTGDDPGLAKKVNDLCETIENTPQGADIHKWLYGHEDSEGSHPGYIVSNAELAQFFVDYPEVKAMVDEVLDVPRSVGRHASAYCISDEPIHTIVPMCRIKDEDCTQFTMDPVQELGLIKMDFLGLNTLNDIEGAIRIIEERRGIKIDIYRMETAYPGKINRGDTIGININDPAVYRSFCEGDTATVFQFKTGVATPLCRDIKPKNLHDLASITANGRPGTMYALMEDGETTLIDEWRERRAGRKPVTYLHPDLEPILKPTDGIYTFQEQIMASFVKCCGYTEEQADEIREIIGKKKLESMSKLLPEIRQRLADRRWAADQIESFISLCVAASSYSFNASHSYCYAYVGYVCMWLKVNFRLEWWNSVLQNANHDDLKDAARYIHDIVIPPDINRSSLDFYVIKEEVCMLVFPLNRIKNVKGAGSFIMEARNAVTDVNGVNVPMGPFRSIEDFYERINRTKINRRVVASLIWSGAFDEMYGIKPNSVLGRNGIFRRYLEVKKDKLASSFEDFSENEIIRIQMELLAIGTVDVVTLIKNRIKKPVCSTADAIKTAEAVAGDFRGNQLIRVGGVAVSVRETKTKTGKNPGQTMAFIDLENNGAILPVTVFPDAFSAFKDEIAEGNILCVEGKLNRFKGKVGLMADEVKNIKDELKNIIEENE